MADIYLKDNNGRLYELAEKSNIINANLLTNTYSLKGYIDNRGQSVNTSDGWLYNAAEKAACFSQALRGIAPDMQNLFANTTYTYSADIYLASNFTGNIVGFIDANSAADSRSIPISIDKHKLNSWQRLGFSFKVPSEGIVHVSIQSTTVVDMHQCRPKLEYGSTMTPYTPSILDYQNGGG